jgi:glutaredoxin
MKKKVKIKVYGSNDCKYCINLKKYLKILRIKHDFIDIDLKENEEEYHKVSNELGHNFIPVIKINDDFLSPERDFETISEAVKKIFIASKKGG